MITRSRHSNKTHTWFSASIKGERKVIRIRGFGWFSLLKLLLIGYAFGSLPFIVLLNLAVISAPAALNEEVKRAISLPGVLCVWPIAVFFGAWITHLFISVGIRLFCAFWPLRITVFVDDKATPGLPPKSAADLIH